MVLSIQLSPEEEIFLEQTAQVLGRSKSDLVREAIHELCQKLNKEVGLTIDNSGENLFGMGRLADVPSDPMKKQVWEKLRTKFAS
jgi:hypothetical protein